MRFSILKREIFREQKPGPVAQEEYREFVKGYIGKARKLIALIELNMAREVKGKRIFIGMSVIKGRTGGMWALSRSKPENLVIWI